MFDPNIQNFYIQEEQSIYLLSKGDAKKLRDWISLCQTQLEKLGFSNIELIGKGAYGFVFGGVAPNNQEYVFKFSRINLPRHIQDRLEEEAFMLGKVDHPLIPKLIEFQRVGNQLILVMERVKGINLDEYLLLQGKLPPRLVVNIAAQLVDILISLRKVKTKEINTPVVHGDIKPSNIVFDPETGKIGLIDWGSSVFAQMDEKNQYIIRNIMDLVSDCHKDTNARMGDVYFIGEDQINGNLSSPRYDEQGLVGTLYALSSGQPCRFGHNAIPVTELGLPIEFGRTLEAMLDDTTEKQNEGGDYLIRNMGFMKRIVFKKDPDKEVKPLIPIWHHDNLERIDTVVYSSRKGFLREEGADKNLCDIENLELDRYYKNFLYNMGNTEKAFLASVNRLGRYPVVGGLVIRWTKEGIYIDSSLNLYDTSLSNSFHTTVNNMIILARSIQREGIFKSCLFKARNTIHIDRADPTDPFTAPPSLKIPFDVNFSPKLEDQSRVHSYFEDGADPDENLELPQSIMDILKKLNEIHHTGCIIFESHLNHLKIHSYYVLLNGDRMKEFAELLAQILQHLPEITETGVSGYMKLPYKDTKFFQ